MEFITIFNQVAILFIILLIGLVSKYKIIDSTGTKLSSLSFVTSPMMVLNSL